MTSCRLCFAVLPLALVCLMPASAQTIARVQLTDNDLNCSQIYAEAQKMDTVIELAGPGLPAAPLPAPTPVSVVNPLAQMGAGGYGYGSGNQASFYHAQAQQAMAASSNPEVRAAANDPNKVAQYAALIQNPQLAVAARNAAAAGVSSASIQSQLSAVGAMQQAAAGARGAAAVCSTNPGRRCPACRPQHGRTSVGPQRLSDPTFFNPWLQDVRGSKVTLFSRFINFQHNRNPAHENNLHITRNRHPDRRIQRIGAKH